MDENPAESPRYATVLWRSLRLRCPRCGRGPLFRGWFSMHSSCDRCGLSFDREPGFYLGSIYVNYGVTAVLAAGLYLAMLLFELAPRQVALGIATALTVLFPMWFFRYARSLFLGFDQYWDPQPPSGEDQEIP